MTIIERALSEAAFRAIFFCAKNSYVENRSIHESTFSKKHKSINYHMVRESVAEGIMRVAKMETLTNLSDQLSKVVPYSRKQELWRQSLWE